MVESEIDSSIEGSGPGSSAADASQVVDAESEGGADEKDAAVQEEDAGIVAWRGCGDGLRDAAAEECDDGNGLDSDSCSRECSVTPLQLSRVTSDVDGSEVVGTIAADSRRTAILAAVDHELLLYQLNATGTPTAEANVTPMSDSLVGRPRLALAGENRSIVVWTDTGGSSSDVLYQQLQGAEVIDLPAAAAVLTGGPQMSPDVIAAGDRIVLVWTDLFDVYTRDFDVQTLEPLAPEYRSFESDALDIDPALAALDGQVAIASRGVTEGLASVEVRFGDLFWWTAATVPESHVDPLSLIALDADHLLLSFVQIAEGTPNIGRVMVAVLSLEDPGPVEPAALVGLAGGERYDVDFYSQRRPTTIAVDGRIFVSWDNEIVDEAGETLPAASAIAELAWTVSNERLTVIDDYSMLVSDREGNSAQRVVLGSTPLAPDGALVAFWVAYEGAAVELFSSFRPLPL